MSANYYFFLDLNLNYDYIDSPEGRFFPAAEGVSLPDLMNQFHNFNNSFSIGEGQPSEIGFKKPLSIENGHKQIKEKKNVSPPQLEELT